jgi:hypothetical protein
VRTATADADTATTASADAIAADAITADTIAAGSSAPTSTTTAADTAASDAAALHPVPHVPAGASSAAAAAAAAAHPDPDALHPAADVPAGASSTATTHAVRPTSHVSDADAGVRSGDHVRDISTHSAGSSSDAVRGQLHQHSADREPPVPHLRCSADGRSLHRAAQPGDLTPHQRLR